MKSSCKGNRPWCCVYIGSDRGGVAGHASTPRPARPTHVHGDEATTTASRRPSDRGPMGGKEKGDFRHLFSKPIAGLRRRIDHIRELMLIVPVGGCRNRQCSARCSGMFHTCAGLLAHGRAVGVRVDAREAAPTHVRMLARACTMRLFPRGCDASPRPRGYGIPE